MKKHTNFLEITELDLKQDKIKRRSTKEFSTSTARKERIRMLWSRARQFAKVIGKVNKITNDIRIFGSNTRKSETELGENTTKDLKTPSYIILPTSAFKTLWNTLIVILSLYVAIILPYVISFEITFSALQEIDLAIDCFFFLDVFINFFSAFLDKSGKLVTSHKQIAVNYLKSWFFVDLLSSLPFELIDNSESKSDGTEQFINFLKVTRIYKIIRLIRLLKMLRLFKFNSTQFSLLWIHISNTNFKTLIFTTALLILIHIFSCLWYFFSDEFQQASWLNVYNVLNQSNFDKYVTSLYFVFTTLTKIGYGDITPQNNEEKIFAMFLMGFGASIYSYSIGSLSSFASAREKEKFEVKEKMNGIKEFAKMIKLPPQLFDKMKKNIKFNLKNNSHSKLGQFQLLKEIPPNLRELVLEHVNKNVVKGLNFFNEKSHIFINRFVPFLKISIFANKDKIYEEKDTADELYFLKKGRVCMKAPNDLIFRTYIEGCYFGEIEIFEGKLRDCTCSVSSPEAELLIMHKKELLQILDEFPDIKDSMIVTAKIKKQKYHDSKTKVISMHDLRPDDSLITESDSSVISEDSVKNQKVYRKDTGVVVSLKHESKSKRKNRRLWSMALDKDPKKSIFHRTKTLLKQQEKKRHSYSKLRNFSSTKNDFYKKKRSQSGEIQLLDRDEFKVDVMNWRDNNDDFIKNMRLDDMSFESELSINREQPKTLKLKGNIENVLIGNKFMRMNIEDITTDLHSMINSNIYAVKTLESYLNELEGFLKK